MFETTRRSDLDGLHKRLSADSNDFEWYLSDIMLQTCYIPHVEVKFMHRRTLRHSCFWICGSGISCKKLSEGDASVSTLGLHLKIGAYGIRFKKGRN